MQIFKMLENNKAKKPHNSIAKPLQLLLLNTPKYAILTWGNLPAMLNGNVLILFLHLPVIFNF